MTLKKTLYESPEAEEIVFASVDAIALSEGDDGDEEVGDDWFNSLGF